MIANKGIHQIYDNLVEPIIVVNLKYKSIVYCNKACRNLELAKEHTVISELKDRISCNIGYETIRDQVLKMESEIIIKDAYITTISKNVIYGNLILTYVDDSRTALYIMFKYNKDEINEVFLRNRCFETIYEMSYSYPFRLDIKNKSIYFIGQILDHLNIRPIMNNYPEEVLESGVIHEKDIETFRRIVDCMYEGVGNREVFRAYSKNGKILWYQVEYLVNRDDEGVPIEVIGEFVNVQEKKELEIKLSTDELTSCLNKSSFAEFVTAEIKKSKNRERHALIIIDVDNFKAINDNLGHQFGDVVLREIGHKLKKIFREQDYVGRIGGDEFMVFMNSVEGIEDIKLRAHQVVEELDHAYKGNAREYRITASIGITLYPGDGKDFETLYNRADIALYDTKSRGKNDYTFYQPIMTEGNMCNTTPFDAAERALSQHFDQQLVADIFNLLTEAKEYEASLNMVLELLGTRFNAERCYIFELNQEDDSYLDNTYEWCAMGISSEIEHLQMIPKEGYQPLVDLANKEGIFYCNDLDIFKGQSTFDLMKDQGILSCLLSFNMMGDNIMSMVGFDDCTSTRIWSSIEISTLMHASKIINQYLKYIKAIKDANKAMKEKLNVLDELYSYAYIVEEETCELRYFNQEFKDAFVRANVGDLCYEVLHGRTEKCRNCPIDKMRKVGKSKYRCIMPMISKNKSMLVDTSDIGIFEGVKCSFFSCSDIDELDD